MIWSAALVQKDHQARLVARAQDKQPTPAEISKVTQHRSDCCAHATVGKARYRAHMYDQSIVSMQAALSKEKSERARIVLSLRDTISGLKQAGDVEGRLKADLVQTHEDLATSRAAQAGPEIRSYAQCLSLHVLWLASTCMYLALSSITKCQILYYSKSKSSRCLDVAWTVQVRKLYLLQGMVVSNRQDPATHFSVSYAAAGARPS